jgi:hypothetical protein
VESLLIAPVQHARPHALPFRTIFEEHRQRRQDDLLDSAAEVFRGQDGLISREEAGKRLRASIEAQEKAYEALADANEAIAKGVGDYTVDRLDQLAHDCHRADDPLKRVLHLMEASALSLSGGGIRSASFSLGVLEGLASFSHPNPPVDPKPAKPLMNHLDYLSTVSGGGYIGSWMMSWVYRRHARSREVMEASAGIVAAPKLSLDATAEAAGPAPPVAAPVAFAPNWKKAYGEVVAALAGHPPLTSGDPEPQPVRHLRSYTSFLAPALGLTVDSFTLCAIVLRNLFINWIMLVPALFAVISFAESSGYLLLAVQQWLISHSPLPQSLPMQGLVSRLSAPHVPLSQLMHSQSALSLGLSVVMLLLFYAAAALAAFALPSHYRFQKGGFRRYAPGAFVSCVIAGSWLVVASWDRRPDNGLGSLTSQVTLIIAVTGFLCVGASIFLAYRARTAGLHLSLSRSREVAFALAIVAAGVAGLFTSALLSVMEMEVFPRLSHCASCGAGDLNWPASGERLYVVFALPLVVSVLMLAASLFCALLGIYEMEEDREWWVRCGGLFLLFNLFWMVSHAIAFYGWQGWKAVVTGVAGLAAGLGASFIGSSSATAAGPSVKMAQLGKVGQFLQKHNLVLPAVGAVALGLITLSLVGGEEAVRDALRGAIRAGTGPGFTQSALQHLGGDSVLGSHLGNLMSATLLCCISAVFALLINFAININLFSLHGMYRMRLMRAFLGASNFFRHPDSFTGFDPRDTPYETDLPHHSGAPLHIINTTLNLTGTRNTAWRQRKAECFTFSPIHAGCWRVGYVPATIYGGSRGVTLATALSISGAAFNPNMGYQSSPLLSLLMTFFNLRLGCWLPNPGRREPTRAITVKGADFFSKSGPSFALKPLVQEALGLDNDTSNWIELTDGGHFENLALYEMVMRRVKRIIVVDAGADPKCQFEDLGNAIRKIYIDLGVPIRFPPDLKMQAGMNPKNAYCAVAIIDYACVDPLLPGQAKPEPGEDDPRFGYLVYIKASITGRESADILQYAKTHNTFPHETTANQFFNESQFESYRHLGSYIVETIAQSAPERPLADQFDTFVEAARRHWEDPDAAASPEATPCN